MGPPRMFAQLDCVKLRVCIARKFAHRRLGIDVFTWLHPFAKQHADETLRGNYAPVIKRVLGRLRMLRISWKVQVLCVFDGRKLAGKEGTNTRRAERRARALAETDELYKAAVLAELGAEGAADDAGEIEVEIDQATLQAAVGVDEAMVVAVIKAIRAEGYSYVVAPYEADAELALLYRQGFIAAALTVDGDFVVQGVPSVFNVGWERGGWGDYYDEESILKGPFHDDCPERRLVTLLRRHGFRALKVWAVLQGCDYVSLRNVGNVRALACLEALHVGKLNDLAEIVRVLSTKVPGRADDSWLKELEKGLLIYDCQVVYDLEQCKDVYLSAPPSGVARPLPLYVGQLWNDAVIEEGGADADAGAAASSASAVSDRESVASVHALGFVGSDGNWRSLPAMERVIQPLSIHASHLTDDEVFGATKLVLGAWTTGLDETGRRRRSGEPVKDTLYAFLQSRNYKGCSGYTWVELARAARDRLQLEEEGRSRAEKAGKVAPPIFVRDKRGRCMAAMLVGEKRAPATAFPQLDPDLGAGKIAHAGWVTDRALLQAQLPLLSEAVLLKYYAHLGTEKNDRVRVLTRGFAHIASHVAMKYFGYHPRPFPSRPELTATRYRSHASYKAHDYLVRTAVTTCCPQRLACDFIMLTHAHCILVAGDRNLPRGPDPSGGAQARPRGCQGILRAHSPGEGIRVQEQCVWLVHARLCMPAGAAVLPSRGGRRRGVDQDRRLPSLDAASRWGNVRVVRTGVLHAACEAGPQARHGKMFSRVPVGGAWAAGL